jgi:hypothetical protein
MGWLSFHEYNETMALCRINELVHIQFDSVRCVAFRSLNAVRLTIFARHQHLAEVDVYVDAMRVCPVAQGPVANQADVLNFPSHRGRDGNSICSENQLSTEQRGGLDNGGFCIGITAMKRNSLGSTRRAADIDGMRKPHLFALFAGAVTLAACAPASTQELPDPRAHHQLVYHESERRVFLVGGSTPRDGGHHFFDDIWSWNGTAWQRTGSLPFPRSSHGVAWDSARNAIVLFGGGSGRTFAADSVFRAWDGVEWRPVGRSPYGGLAEPGMCHDRQRSRLVLFGGWDESNELHGETWEWTGDTLLIIDAAGPSARGGHMFAYDPRHQRCLLFGGRGADDVLGDTWEWDGTAWRQIHTFGPSPRMVGAATTDLAKNRIILFSGSSADQTLLDDTWAWDGEKWELIGRAGPPPRISGQLAFDGAGVVLFGGRTRTADGFRDLNDTWRLQGTSWVRTQVPAGADSSGDGGPFDSARIPHPSITPP